ncbi:transcriptional regulator, RpiR family [Paenibacillus uliginis N3/975]|uniref:Transcriptional regulator, RpiR family n=1 Tax=Paenibacillus uliginis N3/975 TaxID=1313296 RepID=A0A1X7HQH5_9BACL|nr:MurR/RpiR family transcriptional regulator [Paenibacillus uliginis]SMF90602.1 transcriptional regulator, RpiR family [Paenibacillus uliginis N3/975]
MMHRGVLDELQLQYQSLSLKEKEIADYIVQHKSSIQNINIRELADHTHSSTSTITRFCKKIHCDSFVDFKIRLSREAEKPSGDSNGFTQVQSLYNEIVNATADMMNQGDFENVVRMIKTAQRVQVYGLGSSGLSALEFKYRLMRMNITIDAMTDSHMMIRSAALLNENDLIIGLSNSGQTTEIIDALKIGKRNGATTISITNYNHTPLTDISDISLFTPSLHRMGDTHFINSQLAIIYVLDVLSMLLLNDEKLFRKRQDTLETLYANVREDLKRS